MASLPEDKQNPHLFHNMTILVTGATGFLAKLFVEKMVRTQSDFKKMYLLIRADDVSSANQRLLDEVIEKELFGVVGEQWGADELKSFISEKIVAVPGDIRSLDFGIKGDDSNIMLQNMLTDINVIVHSAATLQFDGRYDDAINTNLKGTMNVLSFAQKCTNLKLLLHVSTAYVCGEREGYISEKPFNMGESLNEVDGLNIETEIKMMEEQLSELKANKATENEVKLAMKDMGMQRAKKYGWPNTYVFTKAMTEMWLGHWKGDIPLVIMRPTIVTCTLKDPFPGWMQGFGSINGFIIAYGKGIMKYLSFDPQANMDMIPGDMVVNAIICAIIVNMKQLNLGDTIIYHISSSLRNRINYGRFVSLNFKYFTMNPWFDKNGKMIKVAHELQSFHTFAAFHTYMKFYYLMPLKVLQLVNKVTRLSIIETTFANLNKGVNFVIRLAHVYQPYTYFKSIFEDNNTEKLREEVRRIYEIDESMFDFHPGSIDWEDYLMNTQFPATVKKLF
ncbi:fatty acyl-CoA reductase 3-like [Impatiens glandulifera]|uniref:fatty acyl-CoA reductase 3-like n=1 Tax=Impatiens glandulifera TaxID=253017 RepID=UPI001FB070D6|nr:fatty acyl-CoA reductase 3-like [Impatiens glandulifera]